MRPARQHEPLTPERRALAESAGAWLWQEVRRAPAWLARRLGADGVYQEAWVAVVIAAAEYDPARHPGVRFGAYARLGVRKRFLGLRTTLGPRLRVWGAMPASADGWQPDPADHRAAADPLLAAWRDEDYARQRRCLDWRRRVALCLYAVARWTVDEIGPALGVGRARAGQLLATAVQRLARFRRGERLRRRPPAE